MTRSDLREVFSDVSDCNCGCHGKGFGLILPDVPLPKQIATGVLIGVAVYMVTKFLLGSKR